MVKLSTHPFSPFIPEGAHSLIIGTIPPRRFCPEFKSLENGDIDFYYGSRDNGFWKILSNIFGEFKYTGGEKAVNERKLFLNNKGIGITDLIQTCIHLNGSSLDKNLDIISYKPLKDILIKHDSINKLIYTSGFVKSRVNQILKTYHSRVNGKPREFRLNVNNKVYDVMVLYSPSPTALWGMGDGGNKKRLDQYKNVFR